MAKEGWKTPSVIIATASFALSGFAFLAGRADQARISELENSKLELEQIRTDLDAEIRRSAEDRAKRAEAVSEERRVELRAELTQIKRTIDVWQSGLAEAEPELLLLQGQLTSYQNAGRAEMAQATSQKIASLRELIARYSQELEGASRRRSEIESQL